MRFLISLQPFFFFSGCLMSIIKRDGSEGPTFSKKRVRRCTSFAKAGNWMAAPKRSSFGTRLLTNFLTYHGIFWNLRPLKITTSAKFPRSKWLYRLSTDKKKSGLRTERTLSKIQHAMQSWCWKSRQGQDALEQKAVARPRKQKRTKKSLGQNCRENCILGGHFF